MIALKKLTAGFFVFCILHLNGNSLSAQDPPQRPFSQRDLFELEYASDPRISPDGKKIVYCRVSFDIMNDRTRSRLWMLDTESGDHRPLTGPGTLASSPRWSPDGTRIAYVSSDGRKTQIYCRWIDRGETAMVTSLLESPSGLRWSPDGTRIAFSSFLPKKNKAKLDLLAAPAEAKWAKPPRMITRLKYRADGRGYLRDGFNHVYVVPADGGTARQITAGDFDHGPDFVWSPDGTRIVLSANRSVDADLEPAHQNLFLVNVQTGEFTQLTNRKGATRSPRVLDDGTLIFLGNVDNRKGYQLSRIYHLKKDGTEEVISRELDRNIRSLALTPKSKNIVFLYDDEGRTCIGQFSLTGEFRKLATDVGGTTIGRPYSSGSYSISDNDEIAFTRCSDLAPAEVAFVSNEQPTPRVLTRLNDDLLPFRELGKVEENWFSSSFDNRRIQSWIIKPPQFDEKRKYPLILEIHGGPFANYGPRFSAEMQLMASAGYVVLYVNPRGSTSYGEEFGNLIHHNYPGNDFDDLMSAVDSVIEKGYVDPNRLFVTGGSGGGVLTSWIVGKTNRFRAAVVAKPVINWFSFALTADSYNYFYKYWFPGYPWDHVEEYMKRSPISLVGNVETPTMLLTGEEDFRTPISESEQFYQALKLRKIKTAMVRIPGAGHGITARPSHLLAKVAYILYWFRENEKQ